MRPEARAETGTAVRPRARAGTDAEGRAGAASGARGLLVVGDVVTDVVARHAEALAPGTDTAARIALLPGGAGANVACWARRCGAGPVRLLARVGADCGEWHRAELLRAGVEPVLRVDPAAPTAVVIALVDASAERTLVTDSGAALRLGPGDWDEALLEGVGHVHLSGYLFFSAAGRGLAAMVTAAAHARSLPVSVDPASAGFLRGLGPERFLDAAAVDLLLPNACEAALLSGQDEPERAAAALSARRPGRPGLDVVVTLGAAGAVAARDGRVIARAAGVPARAVDTTGAGDAFTGGLLAARLSGARLSGAGLVRALAAGCRAGAAAVAVVGGRPAPAGLGSEQVGSRARSAAGRSGPAGGPLAASADASRGSRPDPGTGRPAASATP